MERRRRWGLVTTTCNNVVPSTISRKEQETGRRWNKVPEMAQQRFLDLESRNERSSVISSETMEKCELLFPQDLPAGVGEPRGALTRIKDGWAPTKPRFPFPRSYFSFINTYRSFRRERHRHFFPFFPFFFPTIMLSEMVIYRQVATTINPNVSCIRILISYGYSRLALSVFCLNLCSFVQTPQTSSRDSPFPKHPFRADLRRYFHDLWKWFLGRDFVRFSSICVGHKCWDICRKYQGNRAHCRIIKKNDLARQRFEEHAEEICQSCDNNELYIDDRYRRIIDNFWKFESDFWNYLRNAWNPDFYRMEYIYIDSLHFKTPYNNFK